jgi:hypothetical protein
MNTPVIFLHRLLKIERLSRELAELIADQANGADGREERQKRIDATWGEIVRHVGVIDSLATPKPGSTNAGAS